MRYIITALLASIYILANAQTTTAVDTLIMLGGKKIPCTVLSVRSSDINFSPEGKPEIKKVIQRKQVERIIHNNGRVEIFNKALVTVLDENQWESVWVTADPKEVEFLYQIGQVDGESNTSSRSPKAAKQSAMVKLQKRAAAKGANVVLLTKQEAKGGFGDLPGYYLEGTAYSFEPKAPSDGK